MFTGVIYMNFTEFKEIVIAKAQSMGLTDYELYYTSAESTSISAFQHSLNQFTSSTEGGVCFRCIVGGKMGYASTEELSETQACSIVERAAENAAVLEAEEQVFLGEGGKTYREIDRKAYDLPTTEALIAKVLDTQERIYAANPAVIDGSSTQGISERSITAIVNSKGLDLRSEVALSGLVVAAVVTNGQEMANDYQIKLGQLDEIDTDELTKKAAETALRKLGGAVAPTGQYSVVFDPDAMASLLSTFSSVFSAESAQKGLSKLAGREGQVIAAPCVTLVDDPFHAQSPIPMSFDAEGSPTSTKAIIDRGVLTTLLHNLKTAAVAGVETTGNASKAGYDAPVGIRPFTMYIAPGTISEEELLQKVGNGVYINSLGGLHAGANAITGDFSRQSAGFMIEHGVKTTAVKSFTVAGNFYDLLKNITLTASNMTLPTAMGKTNFGSPTVLVEGLSIAGK